MALTTDQTMKLLSAGVLLGRAGDVLSDFEADLVMTVSARFVELKGEANVTDAEWLVIDAAIDAMRPVVQARVTAAQTAEAA